MKEELLWEGDWVLRSCIVGEFDKIINESSLEHCIISKDAHSQEFYVTRVENNQIFGYYI